MRVGGIYLLAVFLCLANAQHVGDFTESTTAVTTPAETIAATAAETTKLIEVEVPTTAKTVARTILPVTTEPDFDLPDDGEPPFRIPSQVSIQLVSDSKNHHLCSGTLISSRFVLTTAHCFNSDTPSVRLIVVAGTKALSSLRGKRYPVALVKRHPKFRYLQGYDIAVLALKRKAKLDGRYIGAISYQNSSDVVPGTTAYLVGWRTPKLDRNIRLKLKKFKTVESRVCKRASFIYITSNDMCAVTKGPEKLHGGNSGGALFDPEFRTLYGFLSYGKKTYTTDKKIYVFTSIRPFMSWIASAIKSMKMILGQNNTED